ncbi:MAG: PAS domain S-box protein, partial [Alphaproteobacteria bacterium]|nr:PAS domain S-box protein [Alphaproteobacteria bacterium]
MQESDRILTVILETNPVGATITERATGLRLYANAAFAETMGAASPEDLINRDVSETWVRKEDFLQFELALRENRPPVDFEAERKRLDGSPCWLLMNSQPVVFKGKDADIVWHVDITARKLTEQALLDSEARFRNLIEGSIQSIGIIQDDRFAFVNEAYAQLLGYRHEEIVGRLVGDFTMPDYQDLLENRRKSRLRGEEPPARYEYQVRHREGHGVWVEMMAQLVTWNGNPAVQVTVINISERKRAEAILAKQSELLQTLLDAVPAHISLRDRENRFIFVNRHLAENAGIPAEQFIGKTVTEVRGLAAGQTIDDLLQEVLSSGQPIVNLEFKPPRDPENTLLINMVPLSIIGDGTDAVLAIAMDISALKQAEDALRESEERYRDIAEMSADWFWEMDRDLRFTYVSSGINIIGVAPPAVLGKTREELLGGRCDPDNLDDELLALRARVPYRGIERYCDIAPDKLLRVSGQPIHAADGSFIGYRGTTSDITEYNMLEEQLRKAQRMEAVGQLTGGIAHDFNNILGIIIGNADMLEEWAVDDEEVRSCIEAMTHAVDRGAALTSRLLAFSRKQPLSPVSADIAGLIRGLEDMFRRTLGETIDLRIANAPDLGLAMIDPHQFEDALLNLAINARHAMPDGGALVIETANATLDQTYAEQQQEVTPGDYVEVAVSDTGSG